MFINRECRSFLLGNGLQVNDGVLCISPVGEAQMYKRQCKVMTIIGSIGRSAAADRLLGSNTLLHTQDSYCHLARLFRSMNIC